MDTRIDTVIIGAGQAGLALGYYLQRAGRRFTIVEAADVLGSSWRRRWDSLTLSTPRREDATRGSQTFRAWHFSGFPDSAPAPPHSSAGSAATPRYLRTSSAGNSPHRPAGESPSPKSTEEVLMMEIVGQGARGVGRSG